MSPTKFRRAREEFDNNNHNHNNCNDDEGDGGSLKRKSYHVMVEGRPYYPFLEGDPKNYRSLKEVTATILGLSPQCGGIESMLVSPVLGGNTNTLFCVSSIPSSIHCNNSNNNDTIPESVLLRIFGAQGLIDRDIETSTYAALAQQGLALAYFGRFANGRIEEWSDWKPLTENDMAKPDISTYIAFQVARLHCCFTIPSHLLEYHNPQGRPTMWIQLEEWLISVQKATFDNIHDIKRVQALQLHKLNKELMWLKDTVLSPQSKIGFCHNDLLASNILCSVPLQLIDFEYGGINYFAYDIANHFNEFAGGTAPGDNATPDYSKSPTKEMRRHFCQAYLQECLLYSHHRESLTNNEMERHLDEFMQEVEGFLLANHLVWGLWGVHQAAAVAATKTNNNTNYGGAKEDGGNDFDYLHYGSCRIQKYWQLKEEMLLNGGGYHSNGTNGNFES
jgi:thiamine kinase-like enzyme